MCRRRVEGLRGHYGHLDGDAGLELASGSGTKEESEWRSILR